MDGLCCIRVRSGAGGFRDGLGWALGGFVGWRVWWKGGDFWVVLWTARREDQGRAVRGEVVLMLRAVVAGGGEWWGRGGGQAGAEAGREGHGLNFGDPGRRPWLCTFLP